MPNHGLPGCVCEGYQWGTASGIFGHRFTDYSYSVEKGRKGPFGSRRKGSFCEVSIWVDTIALGLAGAL